PRARAVPPTPSARPTRETRVAKGDKGHETAPERPSIRRAPLPEDPPGPGRISDPCLRFRDELRRSYCYEVLRRLAG
ncbi:MAG: hypothetical protein IRZ07_21385, partial [Microbispora sp.]|nr:hypothetical protein [Microbispora sp.]